MPTAVGQQGQAIMVGDEPDARIGRFALGDVAICPYQASPLQRHAADLDHPAVRPLAFIDMRLIHRTAALHKFGELRVCRWEFASLPLIGQHVVEPGTLRQQFVRQLQHLQHTLVIHGHAMVGVDHDQSLLDVVESGLQRVRVLRIPPFAFPQHLSGLR